MKTLLISIYSLLVLAFTPEKPPVDKDNCSINGKKLYGTVKVVTNSLDADIKVFVVDNFADINVEKVDYPPTRCGEWQFVDYSDADIKIYFCRSFSDADFTIRYADSFPGLNH